MKKYQLQCDHVVQKPSEEDAKRINDAKLIQQNVRGDHVC